MSQHDESAEAVTQQWVSDRLHQILGLSDKYVAQFIVGLAKKATSLPDFYSRLESTGTIKMNDEVRQFATELWSKVPHKQTVGKPGRAQERAAKEQQQTKSYILVSDPEDDDDITITTTQEDKRKKKVREKKKHLRTDKTSKWESDEEVGEEEESNPKKKDESSSDEWERAEKERMKDLEERDALAERIKKRDKEHTRKITEKLEKKVSK